jgi:hypothetical protein
MSETRKIAAILAADVVGFSKLAGADEDRTLARLRSLRSDLIDPKPYITGESSSALATARWSSFAVLSRRYAALSKCRTAWSNAMPVCHQIGASSFASESICSRVDISA